MGFNKGSWALIWQISQMSTVKRVPLLLASGLGGLGFEPIYSSHFISCKPWFSSSKVAEQVRVDRRGHVAFPICEESGCHFSNRCCFARRFVAANYVGVSVGVGRQYAYRVPSSGQGYGLHGEVPYVYSTVNGGSCKCLRRIVQSNTGNHSSSHSEL